MRYVAFVALPHLPARLALCDGARRARDRAPRASSRSSPPFGDRRRRARSATFPARVFLVDAVLCTALVTASRLLLRSRRTCARLRGRGDRRRVLVVGAGRPGAASRASFARTRARGWSASSTTTRRCAAAGSRASPCSARSDEIATLLASLAPGRGARLDPRRAAASGSTRRQRLRRAPAVPCRFVHRRTETRSPLGRGDAAE